MRKMVSKDGDRLYKTVKIKFFLPGNVSAQRRIAQAKPGTGYSEAQVEKILAEFAEGIEKGYPDHEYKMVELGPATFNFVWQGKKAVQEEPIERTDEHTEAPAPQS